MSFRGRLSTFLVLLAIAVALVVYTVVTFLLPQSGVVDFTSAQPAGAPKSIATSTPSSAVRVSGPTDEGTTSVAR